MFPKAIALMGPTASGKTELALALARELPCDIIGVDSAQVYRGLDIGTAKPDAGTLAEYPHALIDIIDPVDAYSAASFRADALSAMQDTLNRGRIPLLVGGTMMYFKALLYGIDELPAADEGVRAEIAEQARVEGWAAVHRRLADCDPSSAARINHADSQRIQRALEVYLVSGVSMSDWQAGSRSGDAQKQAGSAMAEDLPCQVVPLALAPLERSVLHRRIAERFDEMIRRGLVDEVRALRSNPSLHPGLPAVRAVGYRQVWSFLDGELDRDGMIERGVIATRQLAKRQLTWLRSWRHLHWLLTDATGDTVLAPDAVAGKAPLNAALFYLRNSAD